MSLPLPIISLASYGDQLAIFYHGGAPVLGCQTLKAEIWHMDTIVCVNEPENFIKEETSVSISPEESLIWLGYSETGILYTVDSALVVRQLWKRTGH